MAGAEDAPQADLRERDRPLPGWHQPLKVWVPPKGVFAFICDRKFPAGDATRLLRGVVEARPEVVWVVRETDKRARSLLSQEHGVEPLLAPLVGYWKWDGYDNRARLRDEEIARTCELVFVARDRRSDATNWWVERSKLFPKIKIAER